MSAPEPLLYEKQRSRWRTWLRQNHAKASQVWLVFFKKHTGKPSLIYEEAVEEALCFGWIDGIIRRIDEERYALRFSPRRAGSVWSESNRKRVERLVRARKMTRAGLAKVDYTEDSPYPSGPKSIELPKEIERELRKNPPAWRNFSNLAPSYRRVYTLWLRDAKRPETKSRRIQEAIELLKQNKKLGMR